MARCVIIGGAPIENYGSIRSYLRPDDYAVYCDSGLKHLGGLKKAPDLIVGDFDSYSKEELPEGCRVIKLNPVKDDTDTSHAVDFCIEEGFDDFLLLGMTGRRLDHTLGNVYLLLRLYMQGKHALMADDFSEISLAGRSTVYVDDSMPYFSLINITGEASGITVKNAKYPLINAEISQLRNDLGISNEVLPGRITEVSAARGVLLLIRDRVG